MKEISKEMALVIEFCKENIWEWETRVSLALDKIDMWRAPLQQVDGSLYNEIFDAIEECAEDNEFDADIIDPEEVIWVC